MASSTIVRASSLDTVAVATWPPLGVASMLTRGSADPRVSSVVRFAGSTIMMTVPVPSSRTTTAMPAGTSARRSVRRPRSIGRRGAAATADARPTS